MSLVFDQIDAKIAQIHVLLVGVGGYPFLKNGTQEQEQQGDLAGLKQLTSPPVSVEELYKTILQYHHSNSWLTPLGSIDVLISTAPQGKEVFSGKKIETATRKNIKNAYFRWKKLCEEQEDSVAIFYFAGHGLAKDQHYLLAEDFGENPYDPWEGAFAFDHTRKAFHKTKAKTQVFLVDACREVSSESLEADVTSSIAPFEPPKYTGGECAFDLTLKATANNEKAFGKKNEASVFCQAIMHGLNGKASEDEDDGWIISTSLLSSKIYKLLRLVHPKQGYKQRCTIAHTDNANLLKLPNPPSVKLTMECDPDLALSMAELYYEHADKNTISGNRLPPENTPWEIDVEGGIYKLGARFQSKQFKNYQKTRPVYPPSLTAKMKCQ